MILRYLLSSAGLVIAGILLFRFRVRSDYLRRGRLSPFSSFMELLFFALHANMIYLFIPVKWPDLPALTQDPVWYYPSLILIITGLTIVSGSLIPLGYLRTMGLKSRELKTGGLYRITRNPQVIGYYLILAGFFLSYPSVYSAGWIFIFGIVIHLMIITEEEYLSTIYGKKYEEYMKRVPRYLVGQGIFRKGN
jgi:protein-S-isoprenylcysteine O-methyltransferase Ste14